VAERSAAQLPLLPVRNADGIVVFLHVIAWAPALVLATACGGGDHRAHAGADAPGIAVIDDAGRSVHLAAPAQRIVSLIPARTDLILVLGAADRLIARTAFDDDARLAALPSLGDALTPSVEWLVSQRPDLVIAWPDRQTRTVIEQLEAAGIAVYASRTETIEDVRRSTAHIGLLLGLEARADSVRGEIDAAIATVREQVRRRGHPKVAWFIGLDPPMAAGPGTFVDEMIGIAGGTNAFADASSLWPPVSLEEAIVRQPDVVIITIGDATRDSVLARLRAQPGWRALEAVREGRVHVVDPSLFSRPGPRLVHAMPMLAELVHAR